METRERAGPFRSLLSTMVLKGLEQRGWAKPKPLFRAGAEPREEAGPSVGAFARALMQVYSATAS